MGVVRSRPMTVLVFTLFLWAMLLTVGPVGLLLFVAMPIFGGSILVAILGGIIAMASPSKRSGRSGLS